MSQNAKLLSYLEQHPEGITQLEAFNALGCCRLSENWTSMYLAKGHLRVGLFALCGMVMAVAVITHDSVIWRPYQSLAKLSFSQSPESVPISNNSPHIERFIAPGFDWLNLRIENKSINHRRHDKLLVWPQSRRPFAFSSEGKLEIVWKWDGQNRSLRFKADPISRGPSRINHDRLPLESQSFSRFLINRISHNYRNIGAQFLLSSSMGFFYKGSSGTPQAPRISGEERSDNKKPESKRGENGFIVCFKPIPDAVNCSLRSNENRNSRPELVFLGSLIAIGIAIYFLVMRPPE